MTVYKDTDNPLVPYVGTKAIKAVPMTRGDYNLFKGWVIPKDEDPNEKGYLVQYNDDYISWSPEQTFEDHYRRSGSMDFSHALSLLKQGYKVSRSGWNGKGMFLFLVDGSTFKVNRAPLLGIYPKGTEINYHGHIDMKTADNMVVPWLCSQTDMLADDWCIVD